MAKMDLGHEAERTAYEKICHKAFAEHQVICLHELACRNHRKDCSSVLLAGLSDRMVTRFFCKVHVPRNPSAVKSTHMHASHGFTHRTSSRTVRHRRPRILIQMHATSGMICMRTLLATMQSRLSTNSEGSCPSDAEKQHVRCRPQDTAEPSYL